MGRAGGGGGGGSHSHGGGHSHSRGGSGHRVGSSGGSRAGASRSYSRSSFSGGGSVHHHHHHYGGSIYRRPYYGGSRTTVYVGDGGVFHKVLTALIVMFVLVCLLMSVQSQMSKAQKSTIQRQKLETGNAYWNDNVVDEIGWINNASRLSTDLKKFYDKTGIQPYIVMKAYDSSLTSDSAKEQWAEQYYEREFAGYEHVLLFVYFAEMDTDNDVGYMYLQYGYESGQIMDAEAVDIFWGYLDSYWYSYDADDTDGMLAAVFNQTGDVIMRVSTTKLDIIKIAIIGVVVVGVLFILYSIIKAKFKREKERADETERILSQPLDTFGNPDSDLENRYR